MINFERINSAALSQLEGLLPELLPGGTVAGREYRTGNLNGGPGGSLGVNLDTCKWKDFADTVKGGDPISLVAAVRGCSQLEAAKWLGERLGIERDQQRRHAPAQKQQSSERPQEGEKPSYPWGQAKRDDESIKKCLSSRAINLDEIPKPLKFGQYTDKQTGQKVVQIVAAASKPDDDKVYAVQRLLIDPATWKKTGAKMLGPVSGRGVWFDRKGDHTTVAVGEGIETCLSFLQATNGIFSTVAALSAGNMPALELHEETQFLYILVDSDSATKGMAGQRAAYTTAKQFEASRPDRKAWIVTPDDTCFTDDPAKLDFNDLLQADPSGDSIGLRLEKAIPFEKLHWKPGTEEPPQDGQERLKPLADGAEGLLDPLACFDNQPPPKIWHVQGTVPAGSCVILNGPGGTSKSTTLLVAICAITSGRSIPPFEVDPAGKRVLFLNVEDGADDLQRSLYYINQHHQFTVEEKQRIASNLFAFPGRGLVGAMLCKSIDGLPVPTVHGEWLMQSIENINPAVVAIDTKSRTYGLDENSNSDNAAYISFFETYLPKHPETSFLIVHHNSKERAGDGGQSSARGGSALIDNARGNLVFTHMTEAEAQKHGVNHLDYFVMTNAKNNYARRSDRSIFTRVEGGTPVLVDLENESRGAALDRLIGLLTEDFPGGIQKRELLERDGGKAIRDTMAEEYSMRKPDFKRLVEFGVESTRLIECEDFGSDSHNKPVLIRVRTVTDPKTAPRQLDFSDSTKC